MNSLTFFFKASANNINKIFAQDHKIVKAIGIEPKDCGFDFVKDVRWIQYQSKKQQVISNFLARGKKAGVKNLYWKIEENVV